VRSLKRSIGTGDRTGLDRPKAKVALVVGRYTTVTFEAWLDGFGLLIVRVVILSVCVRLPDFDHSIGHRRAIAIQDPSLKNHFRT
jgi:hypothetical protein